jgi:hypothetical protein
MGTAREREQDESELFASLLPPKVARIAALGLVAMGLVLAYFAFLRGVLAGELRGAVETRFYGATFLLGVVHLLLALPVARARVWAVGIGFALSPFAALASGVLMLGGSFAGGFGVCVALTNLVLLPISLPACLRVGRARREIARRRVMAE